MPTDTPAAAASPEQPRCQLCGEPMPPGEEMFNVHGYSGTCPKPPLPAPKKYVPDVEAACGHIQRLFDACGDGSGKLDAGWVMVVATKALEALHDGIEANPFSPQPPEAPR